MNWPERELSGWGRVQRARMLCARPERLSDLMPLMSQLESPGVLAIGASRSYGDVGTHQSGHALLTERLNRFHGFDPQSGVAVCEPGVTFHELLQTFLPQGWMPPTSPGTGFVTIGGAIANDVHGKNHDADGSFGNHVNWMELLLPSGDYRRVSRTQDPQIFHATISGLGLTGVICRAAIRLLPVPGTAVRVLERRVGDLAEFISALKGARPGGANASRFSVGWIDALASGASLGRGVIETADLTDDKPPLPPLQPRLRVPVDFPGWILNSASIRAFNEGYYRRIPAGGRDELRTLPRFLYPLDAIRNWNRLYGRRGFYQFQCVLPDESAELGLRTLLKHISAERSASFLAVLKTLGSEGEGLLSFPIHGFTLALDFPRSPGNEALIQKLHSITLNYNGRVYLAKDAVLTAEHFRRMYPNWEHFADMRRRLDPQRRFYSDMARRLELP